MVSVSVSRLGHGRADVQGELDGSGGATVRAVGWRV